MGVTTLNCPTCDNARTMHMVDEPTCMTCRYCGDFDSPEGEWFEWEGAWHCVFGEDRVKVNQAGPLFLLTINDKPFKLYRSRESAMRNTDKARFGTVEI